MILFKRLENLMNLLSKSIEVLKKKPDLTVSTFLKVGFYDKFGFNIQFISQINEIMLCIFTNDALSHIVCWRLSHFL